MSTLPPAVRQEPACGACGGGTHVEDDTYVCYDCGLCFDPDDLSASFLDPDAEPCGVACDNHWHGDNKIREGLSFDCSTCKLPTGHRTRFHWTDCQPRELKQPEAL